MSDSNNELGSFLAGFVVGGLMGAAVALILAPQSGSETRAQLTGRGQEMQGVNERALYQAAENSDLYAQRAGVQADLTSQEIEQQARIVLDAGRQRTSGAGGNGAADQSGAASRDTGDLEEPPAG